MHPKILYVEDNSVIRERVAAHLRAEGFAVEECADAASARRAFAERDFALVLLDLMLPDGNGISLLRELRASLGGSVPVLIVSALGEIDERVSGLDAGANDYLAKPFSLRELSARVRAALRASSATKREEREPATLPRLGGGFLDRARACVVRDDGTEIPLSLRELFLLNRLAADAGLVVPLAELISAVWKTDSDKSISRSPVVFVSRLRRKLEGVCEIEAVRGVGYRLVPCSRG